MSALRLVDQPKPTLADAARMVRDGFRMIAQGFDQMAAQYDAAPLASPAPATPDERWISTEEAALIVFRPKTPAQLRHARQRICEWAVGKRWASRPSHRTVLIEELGFREWLRSRRGAGAGR